MLDCHSLSITWKDCPKTLKELAYFSLVRSFMDYCSTVWDPSQKYNHDKLERAAGFVKSYYKRTESVTAMLKELGWHSLSKRREDARLILFYKIINNLAKVAHEHILIKAYEGTWKKNNHEFRHIGVNTASQFWFWFWFCNQQYSFTNMIADRYRQSFFPKTIGPEISFHMLIPQL